jgi:hypothetical protein
MRSALVVFDSKSSYTTSSQGSARHLAHNAHPYPIHVTYAPRKRPTHCVPIHKHQALSAYWAQGYSAHVSGSACIEASRASKKPIDTAARGYMHRAREPSFFWDVMNIESSKVPLRGVLRLSLLTQTAVAGCSTSLCLILYVMHTKQTSKHNTDGRMEGNRRSFGAERKKPNSR